ncbi:uncharacterized protein FTOL_01214 [Fusarium torulosum]|uniref:Uncharacterized protein n=1 Tax=Fusarium torulosum TaxID=33205 RepID=A0AAE8LZI7_9HYPO|nr:uncharacterized protein FTOL_01214 [Fusarium torulosum]
MSALSLAFHAIYTSRSKYTTQEPISSLFVMSNPQFIQVPRSQDPSPNTAHQSTFYSEQTNAWLRQSHKEMPWHDLASVATSSTQDNSASSSEPTPSENLATQGSAK